MVAVRRPTPSPVERPLVENEAGDVSEPLLWPPPPGRVRIAFPEIEATPLTASGIVSDLAEAERTGCRIWLNEGAGRIALNAYPRAEDDERGTGLLASGGDDRVLSSLGRLVNVTVAGASAAPARPLALAALSECHGRRQPGARGLLDRDLFAFLPFQVNAHRFAIHYYVVTRDVTADLPAEEYTMRIRGLGQRVQVSAIDPISGRSVPATLVGRSDDAVEVTVEATDYPRVLLVDDGD